MFCKAKSAKKQTFFVPQFQTISKLKFSNLRPLLSITFAQGILISKNIGHPTLVSGGKKTFKRYLKSEQTHRQTDRRTDISTYRKHRPRGPMLWKFLSVNIINFGLCGGSSGAGRRSQPGGRGIPGLKRRPQETSSEDFMLMCFAFANVMNKCWYFLFHR